MCVLRNFINLSRGKLEIATIMFSVNLFNPYYLHHHGLSLCNKIPCSCHLQERTLVMELTSTPHAATISLAVKMYSSSSGAGGKSVSTGFLRFLSSTGERSSAVPFHCCI